MSKQSMNTLRERRAELGLVQMNLWIRDEDRAAFAAAVEPFKQRAAAVDPAQRPGRKRLAAARGTSERFVARRSTQLPGIALPCRLTFPTTPPAHIRNAMKDEGWFYDKVSGIWTSHRAELVECWIEELTRDWHARIIGPIGE